MHNDKTIFKCFGQFGVVEQVTIISHLRILLVVFDGLFSGGDGISSNQKYLPIILLMWNPRYRRNKPQLAQFPMMHQKSRGKKKIRSFHWRLCMCVSFKLPVRAHAMANAF